MLGGGGDGSVYGLLPSGITRRSEVSLEDDSRFLSQPL